MPIAIKVVASYGGDFGGMTKGACSLWMILYFMLNLYPAFIAVLSFNVLGDKIRDILDPKTLK